MVLNKTNVRTLGVSIYSNVSYTDLLRLEQSNKNIVVPLLEAFILWFEIVNFTIPLWKTR